MKKLFPAISILFFLFLFSSLNGQKYYDDQWIKVSDNYKAGKYKSNLPIILEIQKQAMKDDNVNQLIRSLKAEFSIANLHVLRFGLSFAIDVGYRSINFIIIDLDSV